MSRMMPIISCSYPSIPIKIAVQDALHVKVRCHDDKLDFYQFRYCNHFIKFFILRLHFYNRLSLVPSMPEPHGKLYESYNYIMICTPINVIDLLNSLLSFLFTPY